MKEDWTEVEFNDVLEIVSGKNQKQVISDKGKYPIYGSGGIIGRAKEYLCEEGTTIIGRKGTINKPLFVKEQFWNVDTAFGLSPSPILEKRLLYFFAVYFNFKKLDKSTTIPSLAKRDLLKISFPLIPLPEQRAIIFKIEELFSDLDKGIADLKKAQEQLKIYRQAVLKKAFEGELTKEWRVQQTDLPAAEELFEQIEIGRQEFYDKQIKEWELEVKSWKEKGADGRKPKKPRPLTIPDPPNTSHNARKWDIPKNWIWTQIGDLCFVTKLAGFEYTDYVTYAEDGDLPVLKAENAQRNGFQKTDFSKVNSESVKMLTRSQIFGGELLIVFVGNVGNVAMVPYNQRYFLGPNIGMARPYFELDSKYLEMFLQSGVGRSLLMSAVKATSQPSLSMGTIRQAPVAFPSIKEQHQIVQEIESRLSVCDKVEESITESLEKAKALRQSILKKAFEGTLLSAEEIAKCKAAKDYEPASVLLEKFKAEKKKK